MVEISLVGGIAFAGLAAALLLLAWIRRIRTRVRALAGTASGPDAGDVIGPGVGAETGAEPPFGARLEAVEARLAALAAEMAEGSAETRLGDMAGALIGLIRDKNATLETALAGLEQFRARLRALERIGDPTEARALFEELGARIGALEPRALGDRLGPIVRLVPARAWIAVSRAAHGTSCPSLRGRDPLAEGEDRV